MKTLHSFLLRFNTAGGDGSPGGAAAAGGAAGAGGAAAVIAAGGQGAGGAGGALAGAAAGSSGQQATPPPKPFYEGLYGADGKIDKTALDRLPDHLKPHKDLFGKYDTVDALLHGFSNAHSMAVKKAMAPLPADAPAEALAERKAHLDLINNVPKDPKGYAIARPQELPEQFWHQGGADEFATIAQKHSLSPAAVKELLGLQTKITLDSVTQGQAMETEFYTKQAQAFEAGVQKMGMALDKAADLAARGAGTLGIDLKDPVFKNAGVKLALIRACQLVSEEKLITGDPTNPTGGTERDEARSIMGNPTHPLHKAWADPSDPQHEAAKDRVAALYAAYRPRGGN